MYHKSIDNNDDRAIPSIKPDIFKRPMYVGTQIIFMHDNRSYKQMDGITMGSPLGLTVAYFFLGSIEEQLFNNCTIDKPKLYSKYIDIFAAFDDDQICEHLLNTVNSQHQNLKFAIEKVTQSLSFLDVEINILKSDVETLVWRKLFHAGLLLNFNAICPKTWKSG